jgi:long-chain acyl-CoA synthetase
MLRPFDYSGIVRGADEIARYQGRPDSLVAMLRSTVDRLPRNEAIVELGGERIDYRELWDRSARVAGGLRSAGIQRGDRVAIRLGNSLDWCVAFWGTLMSGAVVVPVNTRFSEPEIEYVVTDSGSRFVFLPGHPLPSGHAFAVEDLTQSDLAGIFYTSGTTGFPKGAMTTHECFLSNIENGRRMVPLPDDDSGRTLVSVPLFHVTGCNSQLLPSCEYGGATVIMRAFEVQAFLRAIPQERINSVTSVPAIFWIAISQPNFPEIDTSGVLRVAYGGAPIAPDLVGRILLAFPNARVGNGFGLTETSSVTTFLPHEFARVRPDSVGFAAPVIDLDLFEPDSGGVGELLVRGPNVVKGYWNKPEATEQTFVNRWLHTGDLARIDSNGFVQIVDRKKDMVNRGGENVYCVEVENALCAHPAIFECAVMGVPDTMMGEKVGAFVVLKPGAKAEPEEICEFLESLLADFKIPQFMIIRSELLPRNPGGKILKPRLRQDADWGKPLRRGNRASS